MCWCHRVIAPSWLVIGGVVVPAAAGNLLDSARLADPFATESMTAPAPERPWQAGEPLPQAPEPPKHARPSELLAALSLAQLTDLALRHNPATREAWAFARAQAAELGIARSSYWPQLDALVNLTHSKPISSGGASVPIQTRYGPSVSLAYTLFDFGSRAGMVEAARYRLLAANLLQNRTLQDVVLQVEQAYYQVLGLEQLVTANQEALKSAEVSLDAARARRAAGLATLGDVYRAETARGQALLTLRRNQGELSKARGQLATSAGLAVDSALTLEPWPGKPPVARIAESLDRILEQAKSTRPDLIAAEAQVRAARAAVEAAQGAGLPTLELVSNAGRTLFVDDRPGSNSYSIGVSLRIPLFSGFANTYNVRLAEAQVDQAEAVRDRLYRQSALDVWQAYFDLNTAATGIDVSSSVLRSANRSAEVALARYKSGVGSLLDLLTAQADQAAARVQGIQSQLDWYTGLARLAHARGALSLDFTP